MSLMITIQGWFPTTRKGLITSVVASGYGFGSCLWTPIQTHFINPDNLPASVDNNNTDCANITQTGKDKYFLDKGLQIIFIDLRWTFNLEFLQTSFTTFLACF